MALVFCFLQFFFSLKQAFYFLVVCNGFYFLCSYDDKVACKMLLDKIGLKGYEVSHL